MRKRSPNSVQTFAENFLEARNEKAFKNLYNRLAPGMLKYVYDYIKDYEIANIAVTNSFAKIWNKIDQYNDKYAFSTWAYRIARNEALLIVNSNKNNYSIEEMEEMGIVMTNKCPNLVVEPEYEFFGPTDEEQISQLYKLVLEEIDNLPEKYSKVLTLRYLKRMKIKEIAKETVWPENSVKTRLTKAMSLIKNRVKSIEPKLFDEFIT